MISKRRIQLLQAVEKLEPLAWAVPISHILPIDYGPIHSMASICVKEGLLRVEISSGLTIFCKHTRLLFLTEKGKEILNDIASKSQRRKVREAH